MNIINMIEKLGELDTEISPKSRRESLFGLGSFGKTLVLAAVPASILIGMPTLSKAANTTSIPDVLNFALTLEYLESAFYNMGVSSGVIAAADLAIFQQIKKHEAAHVSYLQAAIMSLGGTPVTSPTFDFTAKGAFDPFNVYPEFLALSQAFEDTGVRAYKGQAGNLIGNKDVLTAALQIHSVEARHASEVRRLRMKNGLDPNNKGWISGSSRGTLPAATQAVYNGEGNVMQGGVDVTTITTAGAEAIKEAFDEPLTDTETLAIASLFIV